MEEKRPAPDMSGKVVTVRGPVEPGILGVTLMHEHLFVDLRKNHLPRLKLVTQEGRSEPIMTTDGFAATELALWEAKVGLGTLRMAREMGTIADNYVLADEGVITGEVMEFKNLGGGTVVDVTSIGIKRAPRALRRVSEATGLNILMGTGYYQKVFHPEDMDRRSVEDLTSVIVRDLTVGVADTGIRSGIIGEVGIEGGPITPNETRSIQAAARASRLTGAAVTFHRGGVGAERRETLNIFAEEGGDLARVIMGHADEITGDLPLVIALLERGVYIQFDLIGREEALRESLTAQVAWVLPELIGAGYEDRILLSHDVCWKVHLRRYGGFGFSFILEKFLPHLRESGVTDAQIDKMMVRNPKSVLPFVRPHTL